MKKVCSFCGNKNFQVKVIQYIYKYNNNLLIVDDVPCEECEYCGEQYFQVKVLKKIEKDFLEIHSAKRKSQKQIQVPVEVFKQFIHI